MPDTETNGFVRRHELQAHLRRYDDHISRIDANIDSIREDSSEIRKAIGAGPRWASARVNAIVDKLLPALIAGAGIWLLADKF